MGLRESINCCTKFVGYFLQARLDRNLFILVPIFRVKYGLKFLQKP